MMFKLACLALAALVTADGAGTIRPLHHQDLCLDVSGEHFIDGNVVMVYKCHGGANQQWHLNVEGNSDGFGSISTYGPDGKRWCLDREDVGADGTKGWIRACRGRVPSQTFHLDADSHQIQNDDRVRCLDVTDGNFNDWNQVQMWTCNGGENQLWSFVE